MTKEGFEEALGRGTPIEFHESDAEAARTIEASWIVEALYRNAAVRISTAVIAGWFDLAPNRPLGSLQLKGCTLASIHGAHAVLGSWWIIQDCVVNGDVDLTGVQSKSALWLQRTRIQGVLNLNLAEIAQELDVREVECSAIRLSNASVAKSLRAMKVAVSDDFVAPLLRVGGQLELSGAKIAGSLILSDAKLGTLALRGVSVRNAVVIDRSTIDSTAFIDYCAFGKSFGMMGTIVRGQVSLEMSTFAGPAHLEGVTCDDLFARHAIFAELSLIGSTLFSCDLSYSTFTGNVHSHDLKVARGLSLVGCKAYAETRYDRVSVGGSLVLGKDGDPTTYFWHDLSFAGASIAAQMFVENAVFAKLLAVESVLVGADLLVSNALVLGSLLAQGLRVAGNLDLNNTAFTDKVDFSSTTLSGNLKATDCAFLDLTNLQHVSASRDLEFIDVAFLGMLTVSYAVVSGRLNLRGARVVGTFVARLARVSHLAIDEQLSDARSTNTDRIRAYDIDGLTYDVIDVHWRALLDGMRRIRWVSRQPYLELESALRRQGHEEWADQVYYAGRIQRLVQFSWRDFAFYSNWTARVLSGFGVKPVRAVFALLLVVAVASACIYFIPNLATPTDWKYCSPRQYVDVVTAIGLGVSTVLPVSTADVNGWKLSSCQVDVFGRPFIFAYLFKLLGLIVIPFLIATVTGIARYVGKRE